MQICLRVSKCKRKNACPSALCLNVCVYRFNNFIRHLSTEEAPLCRAQGAVCVSRFRGPVHFHTACCSMGENLLRQQLKELTRKLEEVVRERDALVLGAHTPHYRLQTQIHGHCQR